MRAHVLGPARSTGADGLLHRFAPNRFDEAHPYLVLHVRYEKHDTHWPVRSRPPLDRPAPPSTAAWRRIECGRALDRVRPDRNAALIARPPAERTLSGIERGEHVHSWPSAGSPSQHHRSGAWAFRCMTDNSGVRTHGHRQALRRGGSPARPVHPVRGRPGVRRGRPPGRRTGPWALVNEAFAKRFGGGRRTVIGTRLQMTAIDVDDQGREIASASWSTCGHAGVTATAPTVFVPVERVPDDLLGQVHRGPNVQSAPLASRCRRASGLIVWSVANVAPGGDVERLGDCRGSPRSGSARTSAGTCASRRCVPPPAPPTGDADAWCSVRNPPTPDNRLVAKGIP